QVERYRLRLPGESFRAKGRNALHAMQAIDSSIGDHELPNVMRWLSVEPSDTPQPPTAARDRRRFRIFMQALGLDQDAADAFWNFAIVPVRSYSTAEGHAFNKRVVQFVIDPESAATSLSDTDYRNLWEAVVDSVECVTRKEVVRA